MVIHNNFMIFFLYFKTRRVFISEQVPFDSLNQNYVERPRVLRLEAVERQEAVMFACLSVITHSPCTVV